MLNSFAALAFVSAAYAANCGRGTVEIRHRRLEAAFCLDPTDEKTRSQSCVDPKCVLRTCLGEAVKRDSRLKYGLVGQAGSPGAVLCRAIHLDVEVARLQLGRSGVETSICRDPATGDFMDLGSLTEEIGFGRRK